MPDLADLEALLTRQIGPLPVWGWGAAGVGGVVIGRAAKARFGSRRAGSSTIPGGSQDAEAGSGLLFGAPTGPAVASFASDGVAGGNPPDVAPQAATNRAWHKVASAALQQQGYGGLEVDSALRRYLDGRPLDAAAAAIVDAALRLIGPPPEGAPVSSREQLPAEDGQTVPGTFVVSAPITRAEADRLALTPTQQAATGITLIGGLSADLAPQGSSQLEERQQELAQLYAKLADLERIVATGQAGYVRTETFGITTTVWVTPQQAPTAIKGTQAAIVKVEGQIAGLSGNY